MKNIAFYKILICFGLLWLTYSCEKSADQTTSSNVALNGRLTSRDGDDPCEVCLAEDDCCCGIELQQPGGGATATIGLCGNDDGTTTCSSSPPSPCGTISGGFIITTLNSGTPKLPFCMIPGAYFQIRNTGLVNAVIKVTCHYDITNPTYAFITITPGSSYVYGVDTGCGITQCAP